MRFIIFVALVVFFACNSEQSNEQTNTSSESPNTGPDCYMYVLERDSFFAKLNESGNTVTGQLEFRNYQKDQSRGTVKGTRDGDIIKLWYDFQSEGSHSVMEVYFKKEGDQLKRGLGPVDVKGDTSYFTDPSKITYDDQVYNKVSCEVGVRN